MTFNDVAPHECPDCRCKQRKEVSSLTSRMFRDNGVRSNTDNCWDVEDALDGFFVHTEKCPSVGKGWVGGSSCINLRRWKGPFEPWMFPKPKEATNGT